RIGAHPRLPEPRLRAGARPRRERGQEHREGRAGPSGSRGVGRGGEPRISRLQPGECQMVSRATRAGGIHALMLAPEGEEYGVELHFVNDGGKVDISNVVGQITLLLKADQAKEERVHLIEAMHRGIRTRVTEHGYPIHGWRARYGYCFVDVVADGKLRKNA